MRRIKEEEAGSRAGSRLGPLGGLLLGIFRFLERHLRGFFGPVLAVLGAGIVVAAAAGWLFLELAKQAMAGTTQAFDEAVLRRLESGRTEILDLIALEITTLGGLATVTLLVLVAGAFLWASHHRYSVYLMATAVGGSAVLNTLMKNFYDRPRPMAVEAITQVRTTSFPSGHAMTAFVAFATVGYLVGRLAPGTRLRQITWISAGLLILAVGFSRMYLGVHYPSDVIAGFAAGLMWLGVVVAAGRAAQYFAPRRPEVEEQEHDLHAEEERAQGLRE